MIKNKLKTYLLQINENWADEFDYKECAVVDEGIANVIMALKKRDLKTFDLAFGSNQELEDMSVSNIYMNEISEEFGDELKRLNIAEDFEFSVIGRIYENSLVQVEDDFVATVLNED